MKEENESREEEYYDQSWLYTWIYKPFYYNIYGG